MPSPTAQTLQGYAGPLGGIYSTPGFYILGGRPRVDACLDAVPHLIRHWRLDEYEFTGSTITVTTDQAGNDNLAITGSPVFVEPDGPSWGSMELGSGVYLLGSTAISNDPLSIYLWYKPTVLPLAATRNTGGSVFSLSTSPSSYGQYRHLKVGTDGRLTFNVNSTDTITGPILEVGRFYEIVARTNGTTADLWVNGAQFLGAAVSSTITGSVFPLVGNPDTGTISGQTLASSGRFGAVALYNSMFPAGGTLSSLGAIDDANLIVTATNLEVIAGYTPHVIATHENLEVLRTGSRQLRSTQVALEVLRSTATSVSYSVSATTSMIFDASGATAFDSKNWFVDATTNMTVAGSGTASVHVPTAYDVSATTSFVLSEIAAVYETQVYMVSATTHFVVSHSAYFPIEHDLSATTDFFLFSIGNAYNSSRVIVSAVTSLVISGTAPKPVCFGPRYVSASTLLTFTTPATFTVSAILYVSASTSIALLDTASENADLGVGAATSLLLSDVGSQNRDIMAYAATSLGLNVNPRTSNLKTSASMTTVSFVTSAGILVTGTEAASGLIITDLAQAVVWIPWRRAALTLPAGGNLPHS